MVQGTGRVSGGAGRGTTAPASICSRELAALRAVLWHLESKNEGLASSLCAASAGIVHLQESVIAMKRKLSELEKQLLQQQLLEVRKGCHRGLGAGALVACVWWLASDG